MLFSSFVEINYVLVVFYQAEHETIACCCSASQENDEKFPLRIFLPFYVLISFVFQMEYNFFAAAAFDGRHRCRWRLLHMSNFLSYHWIRQSYIKLFLAYKYATTFKTANLSPCACVCVSLALSVSMSVHTHTHTHEAQIKISNIRNKFAKIYKKKKNGIEEFSWRNKNLKLIKVIVLFSLLSSKLFGQLHFCQAKLIFKFIVMRK